MLGFLLEGVQHVNLPADLHRIHRPVSIPVEPQGYLEDPAADASERLGGWRFIPLLRVVKPPAHAFPPFPREAPYLLLGGGPPKQPPDVLVQPQSPLTWKKIT